MAIRAVTFSNEQLSRSYRAIDTQPRRKSPSRLGRRRVPPDQPVLLQLAGGRSWQIGHEIDAGRHLEVGDARCSPRVPSGTDRHSIVEYDARRVASGDAGLASDATGIEPGRVGGRNGHRAGYRSAAWQRRTPPWRPRIRRSRTLGPAPEIGSRHDRSILRSPGSQRP
jgi:hypothetical protein